MWYSESCCCRPKLPLRWCRRPSGKNKGHRTFVAVLYHHSPRQIFLTFRQDPYYSRCRPLPICGITFSELWKFMLWASSLLPSTYFWLILLPSEPSHSWVTSSAHPHRPSSIKLVHQKGWPDPAVPIISERSSGM